MVPNELIREFETKFGQLPRQERQLLETRKTGLFLQAADEYLEDKLLFYLADKASESGFTNNWKLVKEAVGLLAKQQKIKTRGLVSRLEPVPTSQSLVPPQREIKTIKDGTLEELIKGIQDLKVEMTELKKSQMVSSSKTIEGSKGFVERCMWCDNPNHKRGECDSYKAAIKDGIVYFKDGRIRLTGSDEPLKTNFGKGGMKKLVEEQTLKSNVI